MSTWKKTILTLSMLILIVGIVMLILVGMSKQMVLQVELAGGIHEFRINRNYWNHMRCKVKYGGSLLCEYEDNMAKGDSSYDALIAISSDFDKVLSKLKEGEREKIESEIVFVNDEERLFDYKVGSDGMLLADDIGARIAETMDKGSILEDIYIVDRALDLDALKKHTTLLASYTTSYATSGENRRKNIAIATRYLNGTIVKPYERLSFNSVVGERTKDRGFEEAKVIVGNEYVSGYGGGVCQVSTTLYNAWVLAGGDIYYASNHSLPPHYVELSRDAMVSSHNDLILTNNSEYIIYVRAFTGIDDVTFEIYGMESDFKYDIVSEVTGVVPIEDKVIDEVDFDEEYEEIVISNGREGYTSRAYRLTLDKDGNEMERSLIREDKYASEPRITKRVKVS